MTCESMYRNDFEVVKKNVQFLFVLSVKQECMPSVIVLKQTQNVLP